MKGSSHSLLFALLLILTGGTVRAQDLSLLEPGALTAHELLEEADQAFSAGDFPVAEALFLAFERDYGAAEEAKQAMERIQPLIALSMIANGHFQEARPYMEAALKQPELPRNVREELTFWLAIYLMRDGDCREAQHGFGLFFRQPDFSTAKRNEALVLFGTCYLLQGYHRTAARFFEAQIPKLRESPGGEEYAGRAVVLRLMALMRKENHDEALDLLRAEYPRMSDISQLVSFQTLALQLGSKLMEQERYHDAIAALQRIWNRERLLRHQEERLASLRERRKVLAEHANRQSALFQLDGMIRRIEREIENFTQIENFDSALRLRLAMCFQNMERYREAALIMEDMLERMEADPIVESASVALIQSWMQLERWPKALEAAEAYLLTFGDWENNGNIPRIYFMQADALMRMERLVEAGETYRAISTLYPEHELAPKALFMYGYTNLLRDANNAAVTAFDQILDIYPESSNSQDAFYWKGMAFSFQNEYRKCQDHMRKYLELYGESGAKYEPEAKFRIVYCTFAEGDYPASIEGFRDFLEAFETSAQADEARKLIGDALLAEGRMDEAIDAYKSIDPRSTRLFEDGWFKIGKALKLSEDIRAMREHFEQFLSEHPESNRMPEAVYWIGWTYVAEGNPDKAKQIYWETLRLHGNNPDMFAIEDLLSAMPKIYRREGPEASRELERQYQELYLKADAAEETTLALRALWAQAQLAEARNPQLARGLLVQAGTRLDPEIHNPLLIADTADAARASGADTIAEKLYEDLRKWHPNSVHRARAWAGLGFLAMDQNRNAMAIDYFEKFEKETFDTAMAAEIALTKASLQVKENLTVEARATLEGILESETVPSQFKARALFELGDLLADQGEERKAIAYYERIYVVYGKYLELVAKAYLRRAQALERLSEKRAAWEVYNELATRADLQSYQEATVARKRAGELKTALPAEPVTEEVEL